MPPKNTTNKITKPAGKGKEAQSSSTAGSPTKKGLRGASIDNLEFLWACFKNAGSPQVNYKGVGNEFGLSAAAAKARFYRLRAQLDGDNKESKAGKAKAKQEDEDTAEAEDVEDSY